MSMEIFWLGRVSVTFFIAAVAGVSFQLFADAQSPGRRRLSQYLGRRAADLKFLRAKLSGAQFTGLQAIFGILPVVLAFTSEFWPLLLFAPFAAALPLVLLKKKMAARVALLTEQIEPWLTAVSNALRASASLGEAISSSVALLPSPMSEEVDHVVKEHALGTPLDQALDNMAARIDSKTLAGTVLSLKVARRSGGNLPEMLASAAASLREMSRLEGVLRTKTAEGRAQAFVIGAIPVPMVGLFHLIDPGFFEPLFVNFTGHVLIFVACFIWLMAVLSAKKILAVDL